MTEGISNDESERAVSASPEFSTGSDQVSERDNPQNDPGSPQGDSDVSRETGAGGYRVRTAADLADFAR